MKCSSVLQSCPLAYAPYKNSTCIRQMKTNCRKNQFLHNSLQDHTISLLGRDLEIGGEKKGTLDYSNKHSPDVARKVKVNLNEFLECVCQKGITMSWLNKLSQLQGKFYL